MFKSFLFGIVFTIIVIGVGIYLVLTNGLIPANADAKPGPFEIWAASTSLNATLQRDAPKGPNPVALTDENLIAGINLYGKGCLFCHGTSQPSTNAFAKGLNPSPPQFVNDGVEDDPEGYTFWKIKHGIRWSGMPAWESSLNDQQIWTIALFLKHMDKLPPAAKDAWEKLGR